MTSFFAPECAWKAEGRLPCGPPLLVMVVVVVVKPLFLYVGAAPAGPWLLLLPLPLPVRSMTSPTGRLPALLADSMGGCCCSEGEGRARLDSGGRLERDQVAAGLESTRCRRLEGGVVLEDGVGAGPRFEVEDGCMDLERSCNWPLHRPRLDGRAGWGRSLDWLLIGSVPKKGLLCWLVDMVV